MATIQLDESAELRAQLEQLRRECDRSANMTAEVIAAFGDVFRRERRARSQTDSAAADVPLADRGDAMLPLGVKEQAVAVRPSEAARRVSATVLCKDSSQVVTARLSFEPDQAQCVRAVVGERAGDASLTATTYLVRLAAGETTELFEIVASTDITGFTLCRVGGEPCILRLHIEPMADGVHEQAADQVRAVAGLGRGHDHRASTKGTLWKAQELLREGRADRAMAIASAYATDVERPALALLRATLANDDAEWLANVNAYVEQFGIARLRLEDTNAPRFLRLAADAPRTVSGGPLVTVIMPAYNAEKTLALSARSILQQSWAELELIIIDDCSTDATHEIAWHIARVDGRVKVIRNGANVGPYVSKNAALSLADGAYITCHDSDDWAHPQRLERQVEALRANGARACVASWLRLNESGAFGGFTSIGRQSHDGALRLAHVTCMIDAQFMRRYVGYWDCVRFGADGEMLERLERLVGEDLLRLRFLSVLSLDTPGSLTNDALHGISRTVGLSPTRRAYRDAWRQWHATLTDRAYIDFPQTDRPFAAPDECVVPAAMQLLAAAGAP